MQRWIWILVLAPGCSGEAFTFERSGFGADGLDSGTTADAAERAPANGDARSAAGGSAGAAQGSGASGGGSSQGTGGAPGGGPGAPAIDGGAALRDASPEARPSQDSGDVRDSGSVDVPDGADEELPDKGTCRPATLSCHGSLPYGYICTVDASPVEATGLECAAHYVGEGRYCCGSGS